MSVINGSLLTFLVLLFFTLPFYHCYGKTSKLNPCYYDSVLKVSDVKECIKTIKQLAGDTDLFWFGQRWLHYCENHQNSDSSLECWNPPQLRRYTSLGGRLFRVGTFDQFYLHDLSVFPEMRFRSEPGSYHGCDHYYEYPKQHVVFSFPKMVPSNSWHLRKRPDISWPGIRRSNHSHVVILVNVGTLKVHYVAMNFPHFTKELMSYKEIIPMQSEATPIALLIFKQTAIQLNQSVKLSPGLQPDGTLNLEMFIKINRLKRSLIGLNWVEAELDGYSIEANRRINGINHCPYLLKSVFPRDLHFLSSSSLTNANIWITATYKANAIHFNVCCENYFHSASHAKIDPIGDGIIMPWTARNSPTISVDLQHETESVIKYNRAEREDLAFITRKLYTLVLLNPDPENGSLGSTVLPFMHWLVINIDSEEMLQFSERTSTGAFETVVSYRGPLPASSHLHRYFLLLFEQSAGHIHDYEPAMFSPSTCSTDMTGRCQFNVKELVSRHNLLLKGITWFRSQHSVFVDHERLHWGVPESLLCKNSPTYKTPCPIKPAKAAPVQRSYWPQTSSSSYGAKLIFVNNEISLLLYIIFICYAYCTF